MYVSLSFRNTNTSEHIAVFYQFNFLLLQPVYSALSHFEGEGSLDDQKARLCPAGGQEVTLPGEFRNLLPLGCRPTAHFQRWEKTPIAHRFSIAGYVWRRNQHDGGHQIQSNSLLQTVCVYWRGTLQTFMLQLTVLHAVVASLTLQILLFN